MRFLMRGRGKAFVAAWLLAVLAMVAAAQAAPIDVLKQMEGELNRLLNEARYPQAEQVAQQMIDYARREAASLAPDIQPAVLSNLAGVYATWGKYQQAEQISLAAIAAIERRHGRDYHLLDQPLTNLGIAYYQQERFAEAAQVQRRALALRQRNQGANSPAAAQALENLAVTLDNWGYRAEAEPLYKQAMAINLRTQGAGHPAVARNAANLGSMYKRENRLAEAESHLKYVLDLPQDEVYPGDVANTLVELGDIYLWSDRLDEAQGCFERAGALKRQYYGENHPLAVLNCGLGALYTRRGRLDEAEAVYRRELAASQQFYGEESADCAVRMLNLAENQRAQGKPQQALELMDRQLAILEKTGQRAGLLCDAHAFRGLVSWELDLPEKAEADFAQSMRLADQLRTQSVGAEQERAQSFGGLRRIFTAPGLLYLEAGKLAAAFDCLERGRARALVDQLATAHVDLLEGVPRDEAQRLRQGESQALAEVAGIERQLEVLPLREDLDEQARSRELARLRSALVAARYRAVEAYAAIRTASRKFRELVGREFRPIGLAALDALLREQNAMLLYYAGDDDALWVITLGAGVEQPQAARLTAAAEAAQVLGIKPGPLAPNALASLLADEAGSGVLQLISHPDSGPQAMPRLAALWQVLVPQAVRQALLGEQVQRLFVVPEGSLAMLPFETLVTASGEKIQYLIDTGPAIAYAPSASILAQLMGRPSAPSAAREPVLTVGDPAYEPSGGTRQGQRSAPTAQSPSGARYGGLGGSLERLPHSGREARWVADVFLKEGIKVAMLNDRLATERMVRGNLAGRQVVHLACHGLADHTFGNLFGALALAPGGQGRVDATDDGFLSLKEMYELNLTGCELAILSACQTNYGPQQQGEGVWALTRGFVVAGARRVVASNWLVDDEAAASVVSYYCSLIARQQAAGNPPRLRSGPARCHTLGAAAQGMAKSLLLGHVRAGRPRLKPPGHGAIAGSPG